MISQALPLEARNQFNLWRRFAAIWTVAHYSLGIVSVVLSAAVAAKLGGAAAAPLLGFGAAVGTGALTFLNAQTKARAYNAALEDVNEAISIFMEDDARNASVVQAAFAKAAKAHLTSL